MYIQLHNRLDGLGSHIICYIAQIMYAHKNKYYIRYNIKNKHYIHESLFVKCLFNYIDNYNNSIIDDNSLNNIIISDNYLIRNNEKYIHDWCYSVGKVTQILESDLLSYFFKNINIKYEYDNLVKFYKYNIPFDIKNTILVHLRLNDVYMKPDYDGRYCSNYYKELINKNEKTFTKLRLGSSYCNRQAPLSNRKIIEQIDKIKIKYPKHEIICITDPKSSKPLWEKDILPYKYIKNNDMNYDLFLLSQCEIIVLSRSSYALSSLFFGQHKEIYMPLWGHFVCTGIYTKYDNNQNINYFY